MSITVIVPVYNKVSAVEKCLQSIVNQKYTNYEVIIVNDGSTDGSETVIEKFLNDNRFHIVNEKNSGVSHARNVGIKMAKKEHIVFIDADDYVDSNYFTELLNGMEKNNDQMTIISGFKMGGKSYTPPQQNLMKKDLINSYANLSVFLNLPIGKLYSTNIIHKYKILFDESIKYGEDLEFNLRYFSRSIIFQTVNYSAYHVVETDGGLSRSRVPMMLEYQRKVIITAQNTFGRNYDTLSGTQQIVIKASKTVLNHDLKFGMGCKIFSSHIEELSQLLITMDHTHVKWDNFRSIQDNIVWILIEKKMWVLLLIIFKIKSISAKL
ncbi:glycosyltransferase family 2 protein [Leuconostoc mesenteroides]|uniref:glycosyltransferase family 2 protein n=1 Tax=Leuconostoc mesenteroides TaxID=1245 RepID=UPI002362FD9D|nr:glycosyltransferase family A protein [Leuconostoc mesenteroides]